MHRAIQHDRETLADILERGPVENLRALVVKTQLNDGLPVIVKTHGRGRQMPAGEDRLFGEKDHILRHVGFDLFIFIPFRHLSFRRLLVQIRVFRNQPELEEGRLADDLFGALTVRHPRKLHHDLGTSLLGDLRLLHTEGIDTVADDLDHAIRHVFLGGFRHLVHIDLQQELHAALEIETEIDLLLERIRLPDTEHRGDDDRKNLPLVIFVHSQTFLAFSE
ncbi:MAG: hypothetical protein BWY49_00270 [Candidatus Omnitrophica bacterium ADurb.Bin314]|nr:MAG: hypothetical protein BWY49_00270 [Candidatus Omnitrophica bacterium ADurb.Bin314]